MSWKDKKVASKAGRKAGVRRTEAGLAKLIQKADRGEKITMADSKRYAKMMYNAYGEHYDDDWFYKSSLKKQSGVNPYKEVTEMSFKNKSVSSGAGRKAGIRRTEEAIGKLIRKAKSGQEITMADSKKYAKFQKTAYGMEVPDDFFYKRSKEKYGNKKESTGMKTFKELRQVNEKLDLGAFTGRDQKVIKKLLGSIKNPSEDEIEAAITIGLSNNGNIKDKYVTGKAKKGMSKLVALGTVKRGANGVYTIA